MGALINGLLVGGVAIGIFVFTHGLLNKRWPNYKWWDSVILTILLLSAFGLISLMFVGLPFPDSPS